MADRADLFAPLTRALDEMGRDLGQGIDGAVSRAVQGLGRRDAARAGGTPAGFTADERQILDRVEEYLSRGLDLDRWWRASSSAGAFAARFDLGRTFNEPAQSFGFYDSAIVAGHPMAIMGNFQRMFYDGPKAPRDNRTDAARWMRDQIRGFVLRYFMRVSDFREPEGYAEADVAAGERCGGALSWCPRDDVSRKGFGFQQLFYKLAGSGEIGRFPEARRFSIVDQREIGTRYEWIVLKVRIFDFNFTLRPLGPDGPRLVIPLQEDSYLIVTRDFIRDEDAPRPDLLGRYGIGYAFIKNPTEGLFAFGPGEFDAAIERIDFEVDTAGATRVAMVFVANRPERVANVTLDPFDWGLRAAELLSLGTASGVLEPVRDLLATVSPFRGMRFDPVYTYVDLANLLTGGFAERKLCISREQLEKEFLVKHFMQHYQTVAGSLATWRLVKDWLDEGNLPDWVRHGRGF